MRWRYAASLLALIIANPALAQPAPADVGKRVETLEGQMRAVQRKVFPGGSPKYFEPEFPQGQQPGAVSNEPAPSTTAIADINVRLQALERQIAEITGRQEQSENRTRLLEEQFRKFKEDVEFRLNAAAPAPSPAPQVTVPSVAPPVATPAVPGTVPPKIAAVKPTTTAPVAKPPAPLPPSTASVAIKPPVQTDAPYQAAYTAYQAKRYDDAIAMFEDFVTKNPKHALASNALFWQGKAYHAKKQFGLAARSHLRGYDRYREADKAEVNLLGLAESLVAVGRSQQACEAISEHQAVYKTASAASRAKADSLRKTAKCGG
jgi:TolA-binding protein